MRTDVDEKHYRPIPFGTLRIISGLAVFLFWSFLAFYRCFTDAIHAVGINAIGNAIVGVLAIGLGYMWFVGLTCTGHHYFMPPEISREITRFKLWVYFPEWWHRNVIGYSVVYGISHGDEDYHNDTLLRKAIPNHPNDKNQNFVWNIPCDGVWRVGTFFIVPLGGWFAKCKIITRRKHGQPVSLERFRLKKASSSRWRPISGFSVDRLGPVLELSDGDTTLKGNTFHLLLWMNFTSLQRIIPSVPTEAGSLMAILDGFYPCQYLTMKDAADEYRGKLNQERGLLGQEKHLSHELTGIIMRAIFAIRESKRFGVHSKEARGIRWKMITELYRLQISRGITDETVGKLAREMAKEKDELNRRTPQKGRSGRDFPGSIPIDTSTSDLAKFKLDTSGLRKK